MVATARPLRTTGSRRYGSPGGPCRRAPDCADNHETSAHHPLPGDRRRPAPAGRARASSRAGRLLPSEAALSAEYDASRVTIRRALEQLRDEGLLDARQGFGWFVARAADPPEPRPPGHAGGPARGVGHPARAADPRLRLRPRGRAGRARCSASAQVLRVRRLNLADGEPFAIVTVWCPAELGAAPVPSRRRALALLRAAARCRSAAPARPSPPTPRRPRTPACSASRPGRRCCGASGSPGPRTARPVLLSVHVFPAYRTEFVVDMPRTEPSIAPTGLRLVE